MNRLSVERTIWIAAARERVWHAITDPEQLALWFAPGCKWEIPSLQVGGIVKFYNEPDDIALHKIEELDPPSRFVLSWEEQGHPMLTSFLLQEEKNGTRVTITETGFEALAEEIRQKRIDQTAKGYSGSLENLKSMLEGEEEAN